MQAQTRALRGDLAGARAFGDTAQIEFALRQKEVPDDAQSYMFRALGLAYAGRGAEAIAEADKGITKSRLDVGFNGMYHRLLRARVLAMSGAQDRAVTELRALVDKPFYVTRAWLRIDPTFDMLRGNASFKQLVGGAE